MIRSGIFILAATLRAAGGAFAQGLDDTGAGGVRIQRSSSPNGVQIQGNTALGTNVQTVNTSAAGVGNNADAAVGTVRGGTRIQGNTTVNTTARSVNTTAAGVGNAAKTSIGGIGK